MLLNFQNHCVPMYKIKFQDKSKEGIRRLEKSGDKQAMKKLTILIEELKIHPREGTGRPEQLRHKSIETWSRRINEKHRLVYEIFEQIVTIEIVQAYGHYDDK